MPKVHSPRTPKVKNFSRSFPSFVRAFSVVVAVSIQGTHMFYFTLTSAANAELLVSVGWSDQSSLPV
jgi:hypothetical protein